MLKRACREEQGRNYDLSVMEYKVAKETEHLEELQRQVENEDISLMVSQLVHSRMEQEETENWII